MRRILPLCTFLLIGCQSSVDGTEDKCEGPLGKPISQSMLTGMTACCQAEQGAAHCLDASRVPAEIQAQVATCDSGGYCIPDSFLTTGAAEPPATCTAFGGQGVCLSR